MEECVLNNIINFLSFASMFWMGDGLTLPFQLACFKEHILSYRLLQCLDGRWTKSSSFPTDIYVIYGFFFLSRKTVE